MEIELLRKRALRLSCVTVGYNVVEALKEEKLCTCCSCPAD